MGVSLKDKIQLKTYLSIGKEIEYWLGKSSNDSFKTYTWLTLNFDKKENKFELYFHEVFDDKNDGIDDIYEYSYVEPDSLNGEEILITESFDELWNFMIKKYYVIEDQFLIQGNLNSFIE